MDKCEYCGKLISAGFNNLLSDICFDADHKQMRLNPSDIGYIAGYHKTWEECMDDIGHYINNILSE